MIKLFHLENYNIDTSLYDNFLHDGIVTKFEKNICNFVGAKYGVSFNSATSAIFLSFIGRNTTVKIPSVIPPVVPNAILTSGNKVEFIDDTDWIGDSYVLHEFDNYKIVDSAQKLEKNQFSKECNPQDLLVLSFYPTKPVGSCDGGMIVSDDLEKITYLKEMSLNGMTYATNNWERTIKFAGYKMYMNSIQSTIALNNFYRYEEKLEKLQFVREYYNKRLGLKNTSNHLYRINTNFRKNLIKKFEENQIQTGIHYQCLHNHKIYKTETMNLPKSELESETTLSIPYHEKLTIKDLDTIISVIDENS